MDDAESQMLRRSKILVPRQSLLFKLDPVNALSVGDVRRLLTADANEYASLIHAANKDQESSSIGDILDLTEIFHIIIAGRLERRRLWMLLCWLLQICSSLSRSFGGDGTGCKCESA